MLNGRSSASHTLAMLLFSSPISMTFRARASLLRMSWLWLISAMSSLHVSGCLPATPNSAARRRRDFRQCSCSSQRLEASSSSSSELVVLVLIQEFLNTVEALQGSPAFRLLTVHTDQPLLVQTGHRATPTDGPNLAYPQQRFAISTLTVSGSTCRPALVRRPAGLNTSGRQGHEGMQDLLFRITADVHSPQLSALDRPKPGSYPHVGVCSPTGSCCSCCACSGSLIGSTKPCRSEYPLSPGLGPGEAQCHRKTFAAFIATAIAVLRATTASSNHDRPWQGKGSRQEGCQPVHQGRAAVPCGQNCTLSEERQIRFTSGSRCTRILGGGARVPGC